MQALEGTWVLVESVVVQASNECEEDLEEKQKAFKQFQQKVKMD